MKNLKKLGKVLSTAAQKNVNGGNILANQCHNVDDCIMIGYTAGVHCRNTVCVADDLPRF